MFSFYDLLILFALTPVTAVGEQPTSFAVLCVGSPSWRCCVILPTVSSNTCLAAMLPVRQVQQLVKVCKRSLVTADYFTYLDVCRCPPK